MKNNLGMLSRKALLVLAFLFAGCQRSEEIVGEGSQGGLISELSAFNYSSNHFFVDTLYRRAYGPYFLHEPPQIPDWHLQIVRVEVWLERPGTAPDPNERPCRGFINLPPRGTGYNLGLRTGNDTAGITESGPMVKLDQSEYTLLGGGYTGIITIDHAFTDDQCIAIAYLRADGSQFGEFVENTQAESLWVNNAPVILHLVKPRDLQSNGRAYNVAWDMLVKSIYPLGSTYIGKYGFSLQIVRRVPGRPDQAGLLGHSFLNILGLDSYDQGGLPVPNGDGLFDFNPLRTIDPVRGEIIFPYLRPFDNGILMYLRSQGGQLIDSTYLMPEIYDQTAGWVKGSRILTYMLRYRQL